MSVAVVHWNPPVGGRIGRILPLRGRVNNFGDLTGPALVAEICRERGLRESGEHRRLMTVGSILQLARSGDVVWGTGINGKGGGPRPGLDLDIRAVRGPVTRRLLTADGRTVPAVYGDPALLWGRYWPRETYGVPQQEVGFVPNLNDVRAFARDPRVILPRGDLHTIVGRIARCELVVASSLHGVVVAESFGIPARLVLPAREPIFKYQDYYAGTGRPRFIIAQSLDEAVKMGGERPPDWDPDRLLDAFPADLWIADEPVARHGSSGAERERKVAG